MSIKTVFFISFYFVANSLCKDVEALVSENKIDVLRFLDENYVPLSNLEADPTPNYKQVVVLNCDETKTDVCPAVYGSCRSSTLCICKDYYANVPELQTDGNCSYRMKKQLVAFLLEFFLNLGAGHFYRGVWYYGLIKLLIAFVAPCVICILACCFKKFASCATCLNILLPITLCIWWLVDVILFGINYYKDVNYIPLENW